MNQPLEREHLTPADWAWSAGVAVVALVLYASTLCPTVYWYDSAELAAAAALLGIPHPPGYPLYTLLGKLYVLVVPGEPAFAVNLMSAVHGAVAVGLVFALQRRLGASRAAAGCGTAFFGTGPSVWLNASIAEVYTTGLVFGLGAWLLLFDALEARRTRSLLLASGLGGLGFAAHMFVATMGLGYVVLLWSGVRACERDARARLHAFGLCALCALAGASLYLYLPLRLSMHPSLRFVEVNTLGSFLWMVSGGAYKTWFLVDYDRVTRALGVLWLFAQQLSDLGLVSGLLGLLWLVLKRRVLGLGLCLGICGNVWFFFAYDVHDVEVFFLPAVSLIALGIGLALTAVERALADKALTRGIARGALLVVAAYAGLRASLVRPEVDRSHDRSAQEYGQQVAELLPPDAIVLNCATPPEWKYHTVFAYYFQKVLGQRGDVRVISAAPELLQASSGVLLHKLVDSQRPLYMYTKLTQLESMFEFSPEGPLQRIRPRP